MSLMKSYLMPENGRFIAFAVSEILRENQLGLTIPPAPFRLGLKEKDDKKFTKRVASC